MQIFSTNLTEDEDGNFPNLFGDVIVRNFASAITELSVSYVIPGQALLIARDTHPNFTGQYSVLYFAQNFFPSNLNISQVSLLFYEVL